MAYQYKGTDFNPRSLAGATHIIHAAYRSGLEFQSTLPRGSDYALKIPSSLYLYFNPRSLAGATLTNVELHATNGISIHAPSRERPWISKIVLHGANFNPRSLAGATESIFGKKYPVVFQSTLPRGSDIMPLSQTARCAISIHAPSRERQGIITPSI